MWENPFMKRFKFTVTQEDIKNLRLEIVGSEEIPPALINPYNFEPLSKALGCLGCARLIWEAFCF